MKIFRTTSLGSNFTDSYIKKSMMVAIAVSMFDWMIICITMHQLPGYSNEFVLLHENLLQV